MKRSCLLIIYVLIHTSLCAKEDTFTDLLRKVSQSPNDTNKTNILNWLSYNALQTNLPDLSIKYGQQALQLSEQLKWDRGIMMACYSLGWSYSMKGDIKYAREYHLKGSAKDIPGLEQFRVYMIGDLYNISRFYNNIADQIKYSEQLIDGFTKLKNKKELAKVYGNIGEAYISLEDYKHAIYYWEKAAAMPADIPDSTYYNLLTNTGIACQVINDTVNAAKYFNAILVKSRQNNDKKHEADGLWRLGTVYATTSNYPATISSYVNAIAIYTSIHDTADAAIAMYWLSCAYSDKGDFPKALEYMLGSIKAAESINNMVLLAIVYNDVSIIYGHIGDYKKALNYLQLSLKLAEKQNNMPSYVATLGNIGEAYFCLKDYKQADEYVRKSIKMSEELGEKSNIAYRLDNLASFAAERHDYPEALQFTQASLKLNEELSDRTLATKNIADIGKYYLLMAEDTAARSRPDSMRHLSKTDLLRRAKSFLEQALVTHGKMNMWNYLQEDYLHLSQVQTLLHDDAAALQSYKQHIIYRDSVFSVEKSKEIARNEMQYQLDKKETAFKLERAVAATNHRSTLRTVAIIAAAILIISFISFYFYRKREHDKLKFQIKEVRQEALNAQMSDHFIGNTMDSINGFIKNNDRERASEYLILFSRLIRRVLENATEKMVPLQDDLDILKDYLELEQLRFTEGKLDYEVQVDKKIDANELLVPPMIFQVLAENAIKHGFKRTEGGKLVMKVIKRGDMVECTVEDNGIGRKASKKFKDSSVERVSFGGSLAEKLVKTASKYGKQTSYKITDLLDMGNNSSGTQVTFTLPYIVTD